jgi:hypothetical protein
MKTDEQIYREACIGLSSLGLTGAECQQIGAIATVAMASLAATCGPGRSDVWCKGFVYFLAKAVTDIEADQMVNR